MSIRGPLRELGIHDVFQLLDLSRKTGTLHIRSALRDNEGMIFFESGRVIYASIRSNPHPLGELLLRAGRVSAADLERAISMQKEKHGARRFGDLLVEMGAISQRELERQMRFQVEEVIFELMSWHEGFFSFEEGEVNDLLPEASVSISTESLLMEGARRIDEWSRISTKISDLALIPRLAESGDDRPVQLDLLPNEWEVLGMVDSAKSVRSIAHALARSDFEVARVLYGLSCTGVVEMTAGETAEGGGAAAESDEYGGIIMSAAQQPTVDAVADSARTAKRNAALNGLLKEVREGNAGADSFRRLGFLQAQAGLLDDAVRSWTTCLERSHDTRDLDQVRRALEHAQQLRSLVEANADV